MCFSASASFVSGGALLVIGAVHLYKQGSFSKGKALHATPLLFGVQQIAEGVVWLGMQNTVPEWLSMFAAHVFSFIATCLWPVFLPLACYLYDTESPRRKPLLVLTAMGLILSLYLFWSLFFYSSLQVELHCNRIDCDSLAYLFEMPYSGNWIIFPYLFFVIAPLFVCKNKRINRVVAPAFLVSYVLGALLSSSTTFPSVWCFLAAIMSLSILFVRKENVSKHPAAQE